VIGPELVRERISQSVAARFGTRGPEWIDRFREPAGDPGWFGPDSVAWRIHARLGPMLVGGMSALLLQTLHPLVMQGVADHSNYREDPLGRLQRTAEFIAATTYGGDLMAREFVRHVRAIHERVHGIAPDGRPYRASDPELLAYVHVTEVWSFLRAYQRYSFQPLGLEEMNRYLAETALVAHRLGAAPVPQSLADVRSHFREVRPELRRTPQAELAVGFLRSPTGDSSVERAAHTAVIEAAVDLLPAFARRELRLVRPKCVRRLLVRPAATTLSVGLHGALGESPIFAAARERAAASPGPPETPGTAATPGPPATPGPAAGPRSTTPTRSAS
jgi:uncharacterized protein (DUF2236 family)